MSIVLSSRDLTVQFGGHVAVNAVTADFRVGELTAIVGPNGAGKTTYFNLLSGQLRATAGQVHLNGQDISRRSAAGRADMGIGRAFQLTNLFPRLPVLENVRLAVQSQARAGFNFFERASARHDLVAKASAHLQMAGLQDKATQPAASLSHGDKRKLEIALLLAMEPRILMLDEPTAGMSADDVPLVLELIQRLKARGDCTILLVEHKLDVIRSLADRIVVLHQGSLIADGKPAEVMSSPMVRDAYLGTRSALEEVPLVLY